MLPLKRQHSLPERSPPAGKVPEIVGRSNRACLYLAPACGERSNSERRSNPGEVNPGEGSLREPISQSSSRMQPLTPTLSQ